MGGRDRLLGPHRLRHEKLKQWSRGGFGGEEQQRKAAIFGALMLYLDFINLFLSLLRIFGSGRS